MKRLWHNQSEKEPFNASGPTNTSLTKREGRMATSCIPMPEERLSGSAPHAMYVPNPQPGSIHSEGEADADGMGERAGEGDGDGDSDAEVEGDGVAEADSEAGQRTWRMKR